MWTWTLYDYNVQKLNIQLYYNKYVNISYTTSLYDANLVLTRQSWCYNSIS